MITKSYEGIESALITINDGNIHLIASDDGINVAGGNYCSAVTGRSRQGGFGTTTGNYYLYANGDYIYANANGDGVDVNGSVEMTGGTMIVDDPTNSGNGALDYDGTFNISGGYVLAEGSSGMTMAPSSSSSQCSVLFNFSSTKTAKSLVRLQS